MIRHFDFGVSAVRYAKNDTIISKLKVHPALGDTFIESEVWRCGDVVSALRSGRCFTTIARVEDGWTGVAEVHQVVIGGKCYIRIDGSVVPRDDLGDLPTF